MKNIQRRPDLPLRLALFLLWLILISPIGKALMSLGRKYLTPGDQNWLEITCLELRLPHLDPAFRGYRLVQISDLHIGTWADRERLLEAVRRVNALNPDMIAITGDLVTHIPEKHEADLVAVLSALSSKDGCLAVLGNHDHWSDPVIVRRALESAGVRELPNRVHAVQRGQASLYFAGVDDIMEKLDDLPRVLEQLPNDGAAILLAHEPDYADQSAASGRFDLQLSGHTHGGQINLPRLGSPVLPRYGRKYPGGLYQVNGMQLYTNRGLGTADIQFRYRCPAEITLLELYPQDSDSL